MSLAHEAQEFEFSIPSGYSATQRREIAEQVIDRIIQRTQESIDKEGKQFADLSPQYKEYKTLVTGNGDPDLTFSGQMLGSLKYKVGKSSATKIVVGFDANTFSNAKAKGHITGDIGTKRDFLGLPKDEIDSITSNFEPESGLLDQAIALRSLIGRIIG